MASSRTLTLALALAIATSAHAADVLFNAGGGALANGFRCDTGKFSNGGLKYTSAVPNEETGGWKEAFQSHGYPGSPTGDLEYKIPVPDGSYKINLFWGETTANAAGIRLMTVKINGELQKADAMPEGTLDVFKAAGGKNKPYFFNAGEKAAVGGFLTFTFGRVADSKENPMVSGIVIMGANADGKVGTEGVGGCGPGDGGTPPDGGEPPVTPPAGDCPTGTVTGRSADGNKFFMNAGGGSIKRISFGGDNVNYIVEANKGTAVTAAPPIVDNGDWPEPQQTMRTTTGATLTYKIPVGTGGSYFVQLLFGDFTSTADGQRTFDVLFNGEVKDKALDLHKTQGARKPGARAYSGIKPVDGFITIQLKKVVGQPVITGLTINGAGAGSVATGGPDAGPCGDKGTTPTDPAPTPTPVVPTPDAPAPPPPGSCGTPPTTTGKNGNNFYMNVGGGSVARIKFGGDNVNYIVEDNIGTVAKAPTPVVDNGDWPEPQQNTRFSTAPTLTYRIPVGAGPFQVGLQLTESFFKKAGDRVMDVLINGEVKQAGLDVFKEQGFNKPGFKSYNGVKPVDGYISIQLKKVTNNVFLNGIVIIGPGASATAIGGPDAGPLAKKCDGTEPPPPPPGATPTPVAPTPTPDAPGPTPAPGPICAKMEAPETDFSEDHFAHSVTQGPYVQTDFAGDGSAMVPLDGSLSHSHFQQGTETGKIVFWEWTWTDPKNPAADASGKVVMNGEKVDGKFPQGVTDLKLRVIDQFCNPSEDSTTVTVNSATLPGAYCYLYDLGDETPAAVPLPVSAKDDPKPQKGQNVGSIDFKNTAAFGKFPFAANTFAVRCQYFIDVKTAGDIEYKLTHTGPVKLYHEGNLVGESTSKAANQVVTTTKKTYDAGLNNWEVHYLKLKASEAKLIFQFANGAVIPPDTVRHDSGATIPIITSLSKTAGVEDTILFVFGTSFINSVEVKFGTVTANIIESNAGLAQVRAPAGTGEVQVTVTTEAGVSNSVPFTYAGAAPPPTGVNPTFPLKMVQDTIKTPAGGAFNMKNIAVIIFGPDGRLYCGSTNSALHVLTLNKQLQVTKQFTKDVKETWGRAVLGLAFNPATPDLLLYFATSTMFWKQYGFIKDDAIGWKNGKIKSVSMSSAVGDFNNDVKDVVTGLPVSNHDHSVQALEFLPNGKMLVSIGGFTNGGISVPGDKLGGFPGNPLSGAIVECPYNGVTNMEYSTALPGGSKITGGGCKVWAAGLRNSFGTTLHTNGGVYATDNGPNQSFGVFSTNCGGGQKPSKTNPDKLFLLQPGKCHGHPNLNRGAGGNTAECVFESDACVKPLLGALQSSTNGVCEYRSNTFGAEAQGNLFLSKYAPPGANEGRVSRVVLNGKVVAENGLTNEFWGASGLGISEGPRGELVMCRVQRDGFIVLKPAYAIPKTTMFISVMPRKGPAAGGIKITVTGHNLGATPSATFGGKACTNVASVDDDSFTCTVPAGAKNSQVKVSVTGKTGTVSGVGTDFWYF